MDIVPQRATPLVPAARPGPAGRRWSFAASTVLHLAALLALLTITARRPPPLGSEAPPYQLIFDTPEATPAAQPSPADAAPPQPANIPLPDDAPPGPPAPTPLVAPSPTATQAAPAPTATPAPTPTPTPPPSTATAATPAATPSPPERLAFAPPAPQPEPPTPPVPQSEPAPSPEAAPTTQAQPSVRLESPDGEQPLALDTTPILPTLPPPQPPQPPRPRPSPTRPAPSRPSSAVGTLSRPMDLSFAPSAPPPPAGRSFASRALDLRVPTERHSSSNSDPYADIRAANASEDWNRGLMRYWLAHRYYPREAAADDESGTVTLELTVNRNGRVAGVRVISGSGSQWLDMAALAVWRDAKLPPFTDEMKQDQLTFPVPIHYILIHR